MQRSCRRCTREHRTAHPSPAFCTPSPPWWDFVSALALTEELRRAAAFPVLRTQRKACELACWPRSEGGSLQRLHPGGESLDLGPSCFTGCCACCCWGMMRARLPRWDVSALGAPHRDFDRVLLLVILLSLSHLLFLFSSSSCFSASSCPLPSLLVFPSPHLLLHRALVLTARSRWSSRLRRRSCRLHRIQTGTPHSRLDGLAPCPAPPTSRSPSRPASPSPSPLPLPFPVRSCASSHARSAATISLMERNWCSTRFHVPVSLSPTHAEELCGFSLWPPNAACVPLLSSSMSSSLPASFSGPACPAPPSRLF